ncbi:hypothetical protein Kisp02_67490 [Kineosporia sp. NBRC 101731]|nr:hypothetical protein Kisp02_67490 [Kineosporia sp. NBRC 101731]
MAAARLCTPTSSDESRIGAVLAVQADVTNPEQMDAYVAAARAVPLVLPHLRAVGGGAIVTVLAVSGTAAVGNSVPTAASPRCGSGTAHVAVQRARAGIDPGQRRADRLGREWAVAPYRGW